MRETFFLSFIQLGVSFQEFIFLVGVEEGSVILTFMISEQYADQVKNLFENHKDSFGQFGVDGIFVVDPPTVDDDLQNQITTQLGELKVTTNDRLNQVTSQLGQLKMTADDQQSQMTTQLGELKETTNDRLNQVSSQLGQLKKTFGEYVKT
ncbi:hypothetical protein PoB_005328500 [Plakobranchus ocellatus]|uniref:Uncharacterized protein n=1 Tax=Plakobranchus ocellatus TaxID=259542 RepID=A0AAV4C542_9GAST|nr:hypothetical protein PoB_005328500 [Plakobranchus ocellatus]